MSVSWVSSASDWDAVKQRTGDEQIPCHPATSSPSLSRYDERRLERIARRLEELRAWRNAREHPIADWSFAAGGTNTSLTLGDFWPVVATPVQFAARGHVPEAWAGEP